MSRYTREQIELYRMKAEQAVIALQTAETVAAKHEEMAAELMEQAAGLMAEASDKLFDLVHVACPVCDGEEVTVDGQPDNCPACDGEGYILRARAEQISTVMAEGLCGDPAVAVHKIQKMGSVKGR